MKAYLFIIFFFGIICIGRAQNEEKVESVAAIITHQRDRLEAVDQKIIRDSLTRFQVMDSLRALNNPLKTDSIQKDADSLRHLLQKKQQQLNNTLSKLNARTLAGKIKPSSLDSLKEKWPGHTNNFGLQHKADSLVHTMAMDSLRNHPFPGTRYLEEADSLESVYYEKLQKPLQKNTDKLDKLNGKIKNKLPDAAVNKLPDGIVKERLPNLPDTKTIIPDGPLPAMDLPQADLPKIPETDLGIDTPDMFEAIPELPHVAAPIKEISLPDDQGLNIPNANLNAEDLNLLQLPKVNNFQDRGKIGEKINGVQGETGKYKSLADSLQAGNTEILDDEVTKKASGIHEIDEFSHQKGQFDQHKEQQDKYRALGEKYQNTTLEDTETLKEKAKTKTVEQATDYFANQQGKLKEVHEKLAKLKSKHISLPSIQNIPKQRNYFLRQKSVRDRLNLGFYAEFNKIKHILLDIAPSVGYRLSNKTCFYAAYMYRLNIQEDISSVDINKKTYGPRVFVTYDVIKGFYIKLAYETIRTDVPRTVGGGEISRKWRNGAYIGAGKYYNLSNKIRGNAEILYNFNHSDSSPYPRKFNIRFGFDFDLKKKGKIKIPKSIKS